jgi:hypothetical protein
MSRLKITPGFSIFRGAEPHPLSNRDQMLETGEK